MHSTLIRTAQISRSHQPCRPALSCCKRRIATMSYNAFNFEVSGKVQGVFFRAGTIEQAKKIGVVGHVENTSKGTVTGEVQGEPNPVATMKDWLQNKGPSGARIDKTTISNERSNLEKLDYSSFEKH